MSSYKTEPKLNNGPKIGPGEIFSRKMKKLLNYNFQYLYYPGKMTYFALCLKNVSEKNC